MANINLQGGAAPGLQNGGAGSLLQNGAAPVQGGATPAAPATSAMGMKVTTPIPTPKTTGILRRTVQAPVDLSSDYAVVNQGGQNTVYKKSNGQALTAGQFSALTGISNPDWNNIKLDTTWTPGTLPSAPGTSSTPTGTSAADIAAANARATAPGYTTNPETNGDAANPGTNPTTLQAGIANEGEYGQASPQEIADQQAIIDNQNTINEQTKGLGTAGFGGALAVGANAALQTYATATTNNLLAKLAYDQQNRITKENAAQVQTGQLAPVSVSPGTEQVAPNSGSVVAGEPSYSPISNPLSPTGITTVNQTTGTEGNGQGSGGSSSSAYFPASVLSAPNSAAAVNNPTGLKDPSTGQFAQFATPQAGIAAAAADITAKQQGNTTTGLTGNSTLSQFTSVWNHNSTNYNGANVAATLQQMGVTGVTANTPISQINATQLALALATHETQYDPNGGYASSGNNASTLAAQYMQNPLIAGYVSSTQNSNGDMNAAGVPAQYQPQVNAVLQAISSGQYSPGNAGINQANATAQSAGAQSIAPIANTAITNLSALQQLSDAVGYSNSPIANDIRNKFSSTILTDPNITTLSSALQFVTGEVSQVLGGGSSSVSALNDAQAALSAGTLSPATLKQVIAEATTLVNNRLTELQSPNSTVQLPTGLNTQNSQPSQSSLSVTSTPNDPLGLGI